ncbi:MAG: oligosaccharide flippase family protein [Methylococcales bacterium]
MFSSLLRSQFIRHVVTLMSGQAGAQLVTILAAPFVARLFLPEDFGVVALFIAVVTILSVPATFRFELATILPESDTQALKLTKLSFILVILACCIVLIMTITLSFFSLIPSLLETLDIWIWFIPIILFFRAGIKVVEGWATRKKQYRIMASSDIGQAIITSGGRISLGVLFGTSIWALISSYLAGLAFKFFVQLRYAKIPFSDIKNDSGKAELVNIGKEYSDFPLYNMPSGLIRTFAQNIPIIMFGVYFGPAVVGLYAMANRLFRMPVNFLSRAIRRVLLQKLSELKNSGRNLSAPYIKMTLWLSLFSILPTFVLWLIGSDLCVFFLGETWTEAGRFVEILTPWLFTIVVASPATAIIVVYRKQKIWLRYNIIVTSIQFFGFVISHYIWADAETALIIFVVSGILANLYIMAYAYVVVSNNISPDVIENHSS